MYLSIVSRGHVLSLKDLKTIRNGSRFFNITKSFVFALKSSNQSPLINVYFLLTTYSLNPPHFIINLGSSTSDTIMRFRFYFPTLNLFGKLFLFQNYFLLCILIIVKSVNKWKNCSSLLRSSESLRWPRRIYPLEKTILPKPKLVYKAIIKFMCCIWNVQLQGFKKYLTFCPIMIIS